MPGWPGVYRLLEAVFATVVTAAILIIVLATLFLLVRFLLIGTRAAKLYVSLHEAPRPARPAQRTTRAPEPAAEPAPGAAPAAPPTRPGGAAAVPVSDDLAAAKREAKAARAAPAPRTPPTPADDTAVLPAADTEVLPSVTRPTTRPPRARKSPPAG